MICSVLYNLLIRFIVSVQRLNILEGFGGTPEYLLHPPKEHLVEKVNASFFFGIFCFLIGVRKFLCIYYACSV